MADKMMMVLVLATLAASATILILTLRTYFRTAEKIEILEKELDRILAKNRAAGAKMGNVVLRIKVPDSLRDDERLHVCDEDDRPDFPNGN